MRDLLRQRAFSQGSEGTSSLFGLLLPELSDPLLPNLTARPELLPRLMVARSSVRARGYGQFVHPWHGWPPLSRVWPQDPAACAAHDAQFVRVASASAGYVLGACVLCIVMCV